MSIKNILITRQPDQSVELINLVSNNRFYPYLLPMIETIPTSFELKRNIYDYVVLTSPNGVTYFSNYIKKIKAQNYVAVGIKTAEILQLQGVENIDLPDIFSQEGLIDYFGKKQIQGLHILLPSPEKSSPGLKNFLVSKGAVVEKPTVYKTERLKYENGEVNKFLREYAIDTVIFASTSAVEAFFENIGGGVSKSELTYISIGKTTFNFLQDNFGITSYYPKEFTVNGVVELINNIRRD